MSSVLWREALPMSALANVIFWTCGLWSLLANSFEMSKYRVGLTGVLWRSSGWARYLGEFRPPIEALASVRWLVALLVGVRFCLPRARQGGPHARAESDDDGA